MIRKNHTDGSRNVLSDLNFGPEPTDDVRRASPAAAGGIRYAFFVNYARLDGFDPAAAEVPAGERRAIDRWILSDLQTLTATAREAFTGYDVARFALACEEFVDGKLSNWYIRVNRDRFWSKSAELDPAGQADKLAAYQTLYTVLKTLTRLIAPCVPFLAETLWRNLRVETDTESVHLLDYPSADPTLSDTQLSADMDAVLRIVGLGHAARNAAKVRVRQPLAALVVASSHEPDRRAVEHFAPLVCDELNLKALTLHGGPRPLLTASVKLSKKTAAAKLGPKLKDAEAELATLDAAALQARLRTGAASLAGVDLVAGDFAFEFTAAPGFVGVVDKATQAALDTRITPELKAEGLAREVVRFVQDARKDAGFDVSDKITLVLTTANAELHSAIATHRTAIAGEVQAVAWPDTVQGFTTTATVDGHALTIAVAKA